MNLYVVTYTQSDGDLIESLARKGDPRLERLSQFSNCHGLEWRLTPEGINQAKATGEELCKILRSQHTDYFVSECITAMETAGYLDLPNAKWNFNYNLHKRKWGEIECTHNNSRYSRHSKARFAASWQYRTDPFRWCAPGGESCLDVCRRVDSMIETLQCECGDKGRDALVLCDVEFSLACRFKLEHMSQEQYMELENTYYASEYKIPPYGQIIQYTRQNPESEKDIRFTPSWCRTIDSSAPSISEWQSIDFKHFSNEELLRRAETINSLTGILSETLGSPSNQIPTK